MENFGCIVAILTAIVVVYFLHKAYLDYLLVSKYGWSKTNIISIIKVDINFLVTNRNIIVKLHGEEFTKRLENEFL